ncbi:MAG: NAD(P)(+) transhydrogenase (Re/Si-specific) subunit beta, partial [Actinomycetales bacterium]
MTAAGVAAAAAAEPTAIPVWAQLGYLVAAVCFILALRGLSSPRTARSGNLIGAAGAALAVLIVLTSEHLDHLVLILAAVVVGTALGVPAARRVAMTQMPQLVALFNGVGGAAAALVAVLELADAPGTEQSVANRLAVAFTILVGTVSLAGSVLTFAKLQELMTTRPVVIAGAQVAMVVSVVAALALAVVVVTTGALWAALVLGLVGLLLGLQVVLPVGGADVPIVISLLNAFTGLTVAASGYLLGNPLLLVAGTLVGASGTILTRLMASARGRSVVSIL